MDSCIYIEREQCVSGFIYIYREREQCVSGFIYIVYTRTKMF